jgi:hypothetical protein
MAPSNNRQNMFRRLLLLNIMIVLLTIPVFPSDKQKAKTVKKPAALTNEEKEILKNREILENLELLQNFEKVQYLDFLTARKTNRSGEQIPAKQTDKAK